jgi:hypothetical protein
MNGGSSTRETSSARHALPEPKRRRKANNEGSCRATTNVKKTSDSLSPRLTLFKNIILMECH